MAASAKFLIVNADDFGQSEGVNRGIIAAHEEGIVTSASLMVRWPAASEAAAYARDHPGLGLGLHVDLGEWAFRGGAWEPLYEVVPPGDGALVRTEVEAQLARFAGLVGRAPSHLDSHQHVHLREPARTVLLELARRLSLPLRHFTPGVRYCDEFYGQTGRGEPLPGSLSAERLIAVLAALAPGVTELGCHPGTGEGLETMYAGERALEVAALTDPRVRAAVESLEISLRTFGDLESLQR
jgi:predicted glycoside hydrolase/deacetylase ChbG (UPF0249 family)